MVPGLSRPSLSQLEVVDDSSDGLDIRAARLPCIEAAELAPFHHIHTASVVGLLIQHPPEQKEKVTWLPTMWSCEVASCPRTANYQGPMVPLQSWSHPAHRNAPSGVDCWASPRFQHSLAIIHSQIGPCL